MQAGVLHATLRELGATAIRLAAYLGVLAIMGLAVFKLAPITRSEAFAVVPERTQWAAMERSRAAYAVSFPYIPDSSPSYTVLRSAGGGRKEIAAFEGQGKASGRSATIEIYRQGSEMAGFNTPENEIAERAAQLGRVEQVAAAPAIESRFGPMALVDFTLIRDGVSRGCLGFVGRSAAPQLQISGWVCNPGPGLVARPTVLCGLDRLTLLSAGNDPKIAEFFATAELKSAELKGASCNPRSASAGTPLRQPDWLSGRHETQLRSSARK